MLAIATAMPRCELVKRQSNGNQSAIQVQSKCSPSAVPTGCADHAQGQCPSTAGLKPFTAETHDGHVPKRKTAACGRLGIETRSAREHHNKIALLNAHMPKQNAFPYLTPHRGRNTEIITQRIPQSEIPIRAGTGGVLMKSF